MHAPAPALALALALAASPAAPPVSIAPGKAAAAPAPAAADAYARGRAALQAKDAATAARELERCVKETPARVECRWELGWAYYLDSRWADVVAQWEEVLRLDPKHPEAKEHLGNAKGKLAAQQKLAAAKDAPAAPRPPPPAGARLRLRAVGDVMLGTTVPEGHLPPDDGAKLLDDVKEWLSDADLTFANLEGPLCDNGITTKCKTPKNCYAFRSPTRYGKYLKDVGVDLASTANNHSGDFGELCRRETEQTLDALGIAWSGPPGSIARVSANGLKVALIAFYSGDGCNKLQDYKTATQLVQTAAKDADIVVVSFHGGAEGAKFARVAQGKETFLGEDRGDLRAFARVVVDAGADLVIGHGPHLLRGAEVYKDRLVAYSLGNFATYSRFNLSGPLGVGAILEASLDGEGRFLGGRILPTRQLGEGVPVRDPDGRAIEMLRRLSQEDFGKNAVVVADDGALAPPSSKR